MIEVEVKAKIIDFKSIKRELKRINALQIRKEHQKDIYFDSPFKNFAKTDEALRIRKISIKNDINTFITYKGPKIDHNSKTREEIEIAIGDRYKICKLLENLGFKKANIVVKNREIYKLNQYIICLDDVEGLSPYMEIEVDLKNGNDFKPALDGIFETFKKLGIVNGFERRSYLELLEKNLNEQAK
ncbi:MAG: class IV adenylate cyclase [Methanobacteriaceae archaeon]|nr:class IV adenylate cyclase [Candidatus Methanorudis spinitermitis]